MLGPLLMGSAAGAFDLEATRTEGETARAQWFEQHGAALLAPLLTPGTNPCAQAMHCVGVAGTGPPAHAALLRQTAAQWPAVLAPARLAGAEQLAQGQREDAPVLRAARQAQSERERRQRQREAEALRSPQDAQQVQQALQRRIAAPERAVAEQRSGLQAAASPQAGAPTGASARGAAGGGDHRESPQGVVICELGDAGRFACTTTLGTRITGAPSAPPGWRTPEEAARHVGGCRQARPLSWRAGYAVFGCGTGVTGASNDIDVAARLGVQIPGRQTFWCRPMESGCSRTQRPS
jgi:hypothetical protein